MIAISGGAAADALSSCSLLPQGFAQLIEVVGTFLGLSLFSLGGGNTLLGEYHHISVDQHCWLTSSQFAALYALAEACPGPSSMIVGLLGLAAGRSGGVGWALLSGVLAELAILIPSSIVMVWACLGWNRLRSSPWRVAFERGMGPITLGILLAVGLKILRIADTNAAGVAVSIIVAILMVRTSITPLWFMAVAVLLGGLGVINR